MLAGCSTADGTPDTVTWTDPAWFAEQARGREEARSALQSCTDARGWQVPVTEDGGAPGFGFATVAEAESFSADAISCMQELGLRTGTFELTEAEAKEIYARHLDTHACMRAHGVILPDPQTEQTFVESTIRMYAGDLTPPAAWEPYADFFDVQGLTPEVTSAAERACPRNWVK